MNIRRLFNSTKIVRFSNGRFGIRRGYKLTGTKFFNFESKLLATSRKSWVKRNTNALTESSNVVKVYESFNTLMDEVDNGTAGLDVTKNFDELVAEYKLSGKHRDNIW